jgi:hypothetical protein
MSAPIQIEATPSGTQTLPLTHTHYDAIKAQIPVGADGVGGAHESSAAESLLQNYCGFQTGG